MESQAYLAHVAKYANQEEVCKFVPLLSTTLTVIKISTCAGFQAIHLANLKKKKGLAATGVGGVACSRHEVWRPNGLGDLQKGER